MSIKLTQEEVSRRFAEKNIELLGEYKSKRERVKARCYCGKIFYPIAGSFLLSINSKRSKSCGCYRKKMLTNLPKNNLIGKKFGKLTVISRIEVKPLGSQWLCKCVCGKELVTSKEYLHYKCDEEYGKVELSCGCITNGHNRRWKGHGEISGRLWARIKKGSQIGRRGNKIIEFNITIEQVWQKFLEQGRKCALTGLELIFSPDGKAKSRDTSLKREQTASLDRIDSNKGYTIDNVQWVHKDINMMKNDWTQDEFVKWCKMVAEYCRK